MESWEDIECSYRQLSPDRCFEINIIWRDFATCGSNAHADFRRRRDRAERPSCRRDSRDGGAGHRGPSAAIGGHRRWPPRRRGRGSTDAASSRSAARRSAPRAMLRRLCLPVRKFLRRVAVRLFRRVRGWYDRGAWSPPPMAEGGRWGGGVPGRGRRRGRARKGRRRQPGAHEHRLVAQGQSLKVQNCR